MFPTFYIPSAGDPFLGQVILLIHGEGPDGNQSFVDSSQYGNAVTTVGGTQYDTAQKKFGTSSIYFDGLSDYLTLLDNDLWAFGTDDFTVEFWFRAISFDHYAGLKFPNIIGTRSNFGINDSWTCYVNAQTSPNYPNFIYDYNGGAGPDGVSYVTPFSVDTWYHGAWERHGANLTYYHNGVAGGAPHNIGTRSIDNSTQNLYIGALPGVIAETYWKGWLDEIRITRGVARYKGNFAVPTSRFPDP